jgi:hypothetical protein
MREGCRFSLIPPRSPQVFAPVLLPATHLKRIRVNVYLVIEGKNTSNEIETQP